MLPSFIWATSSSVNAFTFMITSAWQAALLSLAIWAPTAS